MRKKSTLVFISLLLALVSLKINIYSDNELEKYPSSSISGNTPNTVSLSKDARWTGNENEAIVDITFKGLEFVKEQVNPTDVIFVVDTSRSMVEAGGIVNPGHSFHPLLSSTSKLKIPKPFYGKLDDLIKPYVEQKNVTSPSPNKISVPEGVAWDSADAFKFYIDSNIKIEIPNEMAVEMWPDYENIENADIYIVPRMYSNVTNSNIRLNFSNLGLFKESEVWAAVDVNKQITADRNDPKNDYVGKDYFGSDPANIYHKDENGKRVFDPVHPKNWFGCDDDCYMNYAWLPLTFSKEQEVDDIQIFDLNGDNAIYDSNGVPKAWYKSSKDSSGRRIGEYQRAHLLYDSIEYFVNSLDNLNLDNRFAFTSFNTKSNALDLSGKQVKSQSSLGFKESTSEFLKSLEIAISHSGEERFQKAYTSTGLQSVNTHSTNYHSGLLSSRELLEGDTKYEEERNKVYIFFSDGQPNYIMSNPSPFGDSSANVEEVAIYGNIGIADNYHKNFSDQILEGIYSKYQTYAVGLQENDSKNIKDRFSKFIDEDNILILDATDNDNLEDNFNNIFKEIYSKSVLRTKIVSMEDTIDSRYFKIDTEKLEDPNQTFYPKEYSDYTIDKVYHDGVEYEKITFNFVITNQDLLEQKVSIPLLKNEDELNLSDNGYIPTNFDSDSSKGAKSEYIDLQGEDKTIETEKVWLPTASLKIVKKSSYDQTVLSDAKFELYYEGGTKQYGSTSYTSDSSGEIIIGILPPGKYVLKETQSPQGYELLDDPIDVDLRINDGLYKSIDIEILNDLIVTPGPTPQTTDLVLSKKVSGDTDKHNPSMEFEFKIDIDSTQSYEYLINGASMGTVSNGSVIKLKNEDSAVIKDIEDGTTFTITENAVENYTPNYTNGIVSGTIGSSNNYEYINNLSVPVTPGPTPQKADLVLSKKVSGDTDKHNPSMEFEFKIDIDSTQSYEYLINGASMGTVSNESVIKLKNGESAVIKDIEEGTTFTITEKAVENYTPNYTNGIVSGTIASSNIYEYVNKLKVPTNINDKPNLPIVPETPVIPEDLNKPQKPNKPELPHENTEQGNPSKPVVPNYPSTPNINGSKDDLIENEKDKSSNLPVTGVESKQSVYPGFLILGLILIIISKKRKIRISR